VVYFKKYLATLKRVATPSLRTAALMTGLITNPAGFSLFHEEETETIKVVFENLSEQICDKDETQSQCGSKLRKSRTVSASKSLLKKHVITYTKPSQRQKGKRLNFDSDSDDDSQDSDSKKNEKGNIFVARGCPIGGERVRKQNKKSTSQEAGQQRQCSAEISPDEIRMCKQGN
jgi:hypothetical protein